jgi:hypothetical protein
MSGLSRIMEEPPFRLLSYFLLKRFAKSTATIDRWGTVDRPHYFAGVLAAAKQAMSEGVPEISVFEFGVAGGNGLVALQECAETIEGETGVKIRVYGIRHGRGTARALRRLSGSSGPLASGRLPDGRAETAAETQAANSLVLGRIAATLPQFVASSPPPTGFIACDVDLYSSTKDVLQLLSLPGRRMLRRVPMYFDDVDFIFNHRFAGELLAIEEFNRRTRSSRSTGGAECARIGYSSRNRGSTGCTWRTTWARSTRLRSRARHRTLAASTR